MIELFSRQAARVPDKIAVEFDGSGLTYSELDRLTNRMARLFKASGVGVASRVVVAMPRGLGEFTAFMSVLKAGGAYVPIDTSHPVDRIRQVLEDSEPQIFVAPSASPLRAAVATGVRVIGLDRPFDDVASFDDGHLDLGCDPAQPAYILFTSGSTGRPKGVEIPRGGISNFLNSTMKEPGISESDRLAAISTTTFDMSELDFFLPLCVGGTVVIADRMTALDPSLLRVFLGENRITLMQATPTTWRMLLDAGWSGNPGFRMFTGGEAISPTLAKRLLECGSELWNLYGPTETSVYSTIERIRRGAERISVGRPIENTGISIRDEDGRVLPPETVGEICISGRGLAIGYFGRPDLTAERFPSDPGTGERYYRTGDLGRWLPDGKLECLGRIDHQVKIRGFRIEPADIEAHLRAVPGVSDVIVVGLKQDEGDPLLAAYWVGEARREDLYRRAKAELPNYMVPSAYVRMDAFPLTTSGKVDRKKLPLPEVEAEGATPEERGLAPQNDHEAVIASIWREVLNLSFVPVDVDFFSLGGTSIRAVQVQVKIKEAMGIDLPLKSIYEHPTIGGIVSQLGNAGGEDVSIVTSLSRGADPIPWFGLMGIHLFEDLARAMGGAYSLQGVHVPFDFTPGVDPFPGIREIAKRYVEAIRKRQPEGPYYLLGFCFGGIVAFEAAAQLEEQGEEVGLVALLDAELPRARRSNYAKRLRYLLRDFRRAPAAFAARAARKALALAGGRSGGAGVRPGDAAPAQPGLPIDIFEGAAVDEDLLAYQSQNRALRAGVIAFRATRSEITPWKEVSSDLGWGGRAGRLECHDIDSNHLGLLRDPHAAAVAGRMIEARRSIARR